MSSFEGVLPLLPLSPFSPFFLPFFLSFVSFPAFFGGGLPWPRRNDPWRAWWGAAPGRGLPRHGELPIQGDGHERAAARRPRATGPSAG